MKTSPWVRRRTTTTVVTAALAAMLMSTSACTIEPTAAAQAASASASVSPRTPSPTPSSTAPTGTTPTPPFLTLLFGRTMWVTTEACKPVPGSVTLEQAAKDLAARQLSATGNVVMNRVSETTRSCFRGYTLHPSWDDLAVLRDTYGWSFVSAGATYANMTTLTPAQQLTEACGSLTTLKAHGHTRGWGLFAYPNNKFTDTIAKDVVSTCFAFGRRYANLPTPRSWAILPPHWQRTISVNGGRCTDYNLPCSTEPVDSNSTYNPPTRLLSRVGTAKNTWTAIQFYRFVTGARLTGTLRWSCTGPESSHWTSTAEIYCYNDFLTFLDGLPRGTVTMADPARVAEEWGVR